MPQPQPFPNNPLLNPNLQNGLPSQQQQSPVKFSSTIPSSQLPARKPLPTSNGLQHSSSHSSRDSSPLQWKHQIPASQLPPGMSSLPSQNPQPVSGPSRNIPQKTSGNLLLTQAQESTNQNILLGSNMNMFNPNSPSLITSSPRQIVQLVGPSAAINPSSENTPTTQVSAKNTGNNVESLPQTSQSSAKPQLPSQNIFPPQSTGQNAILPPNSQNKPPQLSQNIFPSPTTAQTIKLQPVPLSQGQQPLSGEQFPQRTSTPQQILQPTVTRQLPPKPSNGEAQSTSIQQPVQNALEQQTKAPTQNATGPTMFSPREINSSDAGQNDPSQFPPNYLHQQKNFTLNSNTNSTNSLNSSISSAFASSSQFNNTSHKLNQQPQNTVSPNIPVSSQSVKYPTPNQNTNTQQQNVASMPPKQVNQFSQQFVPPSPQFNLTATQKPQQQSPNIQPPGFNQNLPNLIQQNQPNLIQQTQPNLIQQNQPNLIQQTQPNLMQQNSVQQSQGSQPNYPNQQFQYPNVSQPLQPKPLNQFNGPPNKTNSPQLPAQHPGYPPTSNYLPPQSQQIGPPKGPPGADASQYSPAQHSPLTRKYPTPNTGYPNQNLRQQTFASPVPTSFTPNQNSNVLPPQPNYPVQPLSGPTQTNYPYSTNSPASPSGNYMNINQQFNNMNITQTGFNRMWGAENIDLLQHRNVLPAEKVEPPKIKLLQECMDAANCHPDIFRCTLTKVPDTSSLLNKSRLPLGVLIHPFRDLNYLPVIQCSTIVRCRACRTYINPFVYFVDTKRWKCNLCFRVNELPEEFQYDPVSKSYGDPSRRPEIKSSTIEYIAPSEYMLRPPQPAVYLFVLDVSQMAVESGYLRVLCDTLIDELENLPGDSRTQIGFICFNSALRFYSLADGLSQPHEMIVVDIEDVFLPCPDNLLVNLRERKEMVKDLLVQLPNRFINSHDNGSALGAALQAAFKMMSPTGGRVSVFQCILPTVGPGALTSREVPTQRSSAEVAHLNPATDFYKRLALDCSAQQIAVDLFVLNSQYVDLSTISGISKFSGGCIHHYPLFKASRQIQCQQFDNCLRRYLTRKIGYEAVMRIRCTRGLSIHTFHGNFFVRSTDLLSLPNCNPDAGFGMQVSIEENLTDLQTVCFQAALLYTSSKGERRIRVHTLCLPIATNLSEILNSADQQCIVGLLAKMAVDRSLSSSLTDARDAFINVVTDVLSAYKLALNQGSGSGGGLLAPHTLKLLPMYISALLKYVAFRTGQNTRLDDRVFAMCEMKTLPLGQLIQAIYPDLYPIHCLTEEGGLPTEDGRIIPQPGRLQLSAEKLDSRGAYLLDCGHHMIVYIGHNVNPHFINNALGFQHFAAIPEELLDFPKIETPENELLHLFVGNLNEEKPFSATIQIVRDDSPQRVLFTEKLIEDRIENALSYYEFLQHLKAHVK